MNTLTFPGGRWGGGVFSGDILEAAPTVPSVAATPPTLLSANAMYFSHAIFNNTLCVMKGDTQHCRAAWRE